MSLSVLIRLYRYRVRPVSVQNAAQARWRYLFFPYSSMTLVGYKSRDGCQRSIWNQNKDAVFRDMKVLIPIFWMQIISSLLLPRQVTVTFVFKTGADVRILQSFSLLISYNLFLDQGYHVLYQEDKNDKKET